VVVRGSAVVVVLAAVSDGVDAEHVSAKRFVLGNYRLNHQKFPFRMC